MIDIKKFGAIDIGSNAVRLLVSSVITTKEEPPRFKKVSLVRVPIRLGEDVFTINKVGEKNKERLIDAMKAFKLLMDVHQIKAYRACATSAMRNAENSNDLQQIIKKETGITIDIIDGKEEAEIIAQTDLNEITKDKKTYLFVDVGGGSTEFTLFNKGKEVASKSFKIGTVRLLNDLVSENLWLKAENWILSHTKGYSEIALVGSGGNINNIFKSSGKASGRSLNRKYLNDFYKKVSNMSYEERIWKLNLNVDRADVIVPAAKIFINAMKWSGAEKIYVPKIGLSDGIIRSVYEKYNNKQ